jgi:hypothetical protein
MIPNMDIPRRAEDGSIFYVTFSPETIAEIEMKYMKEARTNDTNLDHNDKSIAGAYIFESWIIENPEDKAKSVYGFDLPIGSWMIKMKVDDAATWARVKDGTIRGFSVEGLFADVKDIEAERQYNEIKKILKNNN